MNWGRLSRICLIGLLVMLVWLALPAAQCTLSGMNETQIGAVDEEHHEVSSSDTQRVGQSTGFLGRFFGNVKVCFALHPFSTQEEWKRKAALGCGAGFVIFGLVGWAMRPRYLAG
jgi:hypothetical protein